MMTTQMTPNEAYEYATSWGSFMRAGDPGACMYGFDHNCRPQSEDHRQAVLRHMATCRLRVVESPEDYDDGELEQLDAFVAFITERPIEPETPDSPINREITFQNANPSDVSYGAVLDACNGESFPMTIRCQDEWAAIAAAVNQGIDSHLEGIANAADEFDNGSCNVTPHNLCILLRRLSEINDEELYEAADRLQTDILTVLGFDDCGNYVGRDD